MKTIAIIPSGGSGTRFGGNMPKQYLQVNGKEIIAFTLEVFQKCTLIDEIAVSADPDYFALLQSIKEKYGITKLSYIVNGGKERQDSVFNALSSLTCTSTDLVAVHDAVRPLLPQEVLEQAVISAKSYDNVVVGIKAKDTLIEYETEDRLTVQNYLNRDKVYYAQTPQIFRYNVLLDAMNKARNEAFLGTDESMLVKRAGYPVYIADGSSFNFKITTSEDFELFKRAVCSI